MKPQHEIALEKANAIRLEQARIKREIRALPGPEGRRRLAELILRDDEVVRRMRLRYLLRCGRRIILRPLLANAGIGAARLERRICELSPRERMAIARYLQRSANERERDLIAA